MFIIPYLVLAGVVLLFFAVTCLMIFGLPGKKKSAEPIMADLDKTMEIPTISKEKAAASPIAGKPAVDDATEILPIIEKDDAEEEKTRVFAKKDFENTAPFEAVASATKSPFPPEPAPKILEDHPKVDTLEEYFVRHFLNRYGAVSRTVEQDTRKVTHHLIEKLAMSDRELVDTLTHIMVQEAMQNAQRTYVMMPTPVVLAMVSDAFSDVAHGNRSDTKTILAYDALNPSTYEAILLFAR